MPRITEKINIENHNRKAKKQQRDIESTKCSCCQVSRTRGASAKKKYIVERGEQSVVVEQEEEGQERN